QLNERLRFFYAEVRNAEGDLYSKSSFVGLRAAIHRHIRGPPFERSINIIQDREFHTANNVFLSMIKKLKRDGLDQTTHHAAIPENDLKKIRESLDTETPSGLLRKVWFDLTLGFARRGKENQRELTASSFRVSTDEQGFEFIEMTHSEVTKNHRGDLKDSNGPNKRIYATSDQFCPVLSLKKYMSLLNPNNGAFYQAPKRRVHVDDTEWYTTRPVGVNVIGNMMKEISTNAGLKVYTNHCLRATAITLLSNAGIENCEICKITGHKTDESLKSYSIDSSSAQKRHYSNILQGQQQLANERNLVPVQDTNILPLSTAPVNNFQVNSSANSHGLFHICNSTVTVNNFFHPS
ncbi:uncharacterized protein, partial [Haliotis cracherodii]|uniref:uncharacterized protein n=1 Tax=Haliotis cracherodii TaxID=6455 RepID=UPI0039EA024C